MIEADRASSVVGVFDVTRDNVVVEERRSRSEVSAAVAGAARSLRLDRVAAEVVAKLDEAGIDSLLLKGAVHAQWLYSDGTPRPYRDIDILVAPGEWDSAADVLRSLGFEDPLLGRRGDERCAHGTAYVRPPGCDRVDLHRCISGVTADADLCWSVLRASAETAIVGGAQVRALSRAARTMHVALHATQHGLRESRPREELARAVSMVDIDTWGEAGRLAAMLGAQEAMAAGLRLVDGGDLIAGQLQLPAVVSTRVAARAWSATRGSDSLVQFLDASTLRAKLRVIGTKVVPSPALMRSGSPLARRGRVCLGAAYVLRLLVTVRQAPALWRDYRLVASRAKGDDGVSTAERAADNRNNST